MDIGGYSVGLIIHNPPLLKSNGLRVLFPVDSFCVVDEYKLKGVEKVKYMHGEEERTNTRNQENLVMIDT